MRRSLLLSVAAALVATALFGGPLAAQPPVETELADGVLLFAFDRLPLPAIDDAGSKAKWSVARGKLDPNSGTLGTLSDGHLPGQINSPRENLFFDVASDGGWLLADLGQASELKQIVTYSCHVGVRAPQLYRVMAANDLNDQWTLIATVDTRKLGFRGQHAAAIGDGKATLGNYRYVRLEVEPSDRADPYGQTFFSEIDLLVADDTNVKRLPKPQKKEINFETPDGAYRFSIDLSLAPDLTDWSREKLKPVIAQWYPRIVKMLPSDQFQPATSIMFCFESDETMHGIPAWADGARISMNASWFRSEKDREALGAVVHEMVHVVQSYQPSQKPGGQRAPGWLIEGMPDYVRWFLYEPETQGAQMTPQQRAAAKHDASYRVSANFIDWVIRTHDKQGDLLQQLNAALRNGSYNADIWRKLTEKTEQELADQWRQM